LLKTFESIGHLDIVWSRPIQAKAALTCSHVGKKIVSQIFSQREDFRFTINFYLFAILPEINPTPSGGTEWQDWAGFFAPMGDAQHENISPELAHTDVEQI